MCSLCWEAHAAGYMTRTEVWQCVYYLDIIRSHRDELRRIPKREPDDPRYRLRLGEGLTPFYFRYDGDLKDWYFLKYLPSRRRRIYYTTASGRERSAPEERAARGVAGTNEVCTKLTDF